jgi:hypothetical protein
MPDDPQTWAEAIKLLGEFRGVLNDRYPRRPRPGESKPVFVPRDLLTDDDIDFNATLMQRSADRASNEAALLRAFAASRADKPS